MIPFSFWKSNVDEGPVYFGPAPYYAFDPAFYNSLADNSVIGDWTIDAISTGVSFAAAVSGSPLLRKAALNGHSVIEYPVVSRTHFGRAPYSSNTNWAVAIIYKYDTSSENNVLMNFGDSTTYEYGGYLYHLASSELKFFVSSVGGPSSTDRLDTTGGWHILVMSSTSGVAKIVLDGVTLTFADVLPSVDAFDFSFPFSSPIHGNGIITQIAGFHTYDRGLTDPEIVAVREDWLTKFGL